MSRFLPGSFAVLIAATALLSFAAPSWATASQAPSAVAVPIDQAATGAHVARPAADGRIERPDVEVVESTGRNIPNPVTPQRIESFLTETITTTKAGHLLVTKSMELATTCTPESGVIYFLTLDEVPIRNSAVFSRTGIIGQVSGVTTEVVAAGTHTIRVAQACTVPGAYPSGGSVTLVGLSAVIVLP